MVKGRQRKRNASGKNALGSVRIIGGLWRGRKLPVRDLPGLRPSGDRSRETLFNWLQASIQGAACVDLFAGSGALGFEAASRGAEQVIVIDNQKESVATLHESREMLQADQVCVLEADALKWLKSCTPQSIDIAFIDPPFGCGLEQRALQLLHRHDCLKSGGLVYVESARQSPVFAPGPAWEIVREKTMGDVRLSLLKKSDVGER